MSPVTEPLRVAVLGARGIGQVHARILHELGATVCAVLGSTESSAAAAAAELRRAFGIEAAPFFSLDRLLDTAPDAVSICTPPHLHHSQMIAALDRGLGVFCEKPLFWSPDITHNQLLAQLSQLEQHVNQRLAVNTSNATFIDAVRNRLPAATGVEHFAFRFHTNGPYQGPHIGVDLIPHGLSLLLRLMGAHPLSAFATTCTDTQYHCEFTYGGCRVRFDFQQDRRGDRALAFQVNEHEFRRVQEGSGSTYRVLLADGATGELVPVEDPFRAYISAFLTRCREGTPFPQRERVEAMENLRLMGQLLRSPVSGKHPG